MLTFSANWCGPCRSLYPLQRNLVEKFKDEPFVLLSVNRDDRVDTLKSSLASGVITWRCWWDGLKGPSHAAWRFPGSWAVFLLDDNGVIQDVKLDRATLQSEFERAIGELLGNLASEKKPTR